jgi:hypothetical protein
MKIFISGILGLLTGAALFITGLYFNPFIGQPAVSPLAVTDVQVIDLSFSAVPSDAILYTNHGGSVVAPRPERVAELWEPAVDKTDLLVTALQDGRGGTAGIGIKMRSHSEDTAVMRGEALANSIWHIYLPNQGTMMIDQTENYWSYIRDVMVPARLSSGDNWRGSYHRVMTSGPGSLGTARVNGGSGALAGVTTESVESLTAAGYSSASGPVAMEGSLTIAIPEQQIAAQD